MSVYKQTFEINSCDTDPQNHVRADAIDKYVMEAAGRDADEWGMSIPALQAENRTWVLARIAVKFFDRPGWKSNLTVETWARGFRGFPAMRDFLVSGPNGESVAAGCSIWFILDLTTRKPVRLDCYADRGPAQPDKTAGVPEPGKIPTVAGWDRETRIPLRLSDIDLNGHVNNVYYLDWVYEGVPPEILSNMRMSEANIHYTAETFYPETVLSRCTPDPKPEASGDGKAFIHSLVRASDGVEVVKARTVWASLP
jgi:medium-chain acyl-[acyl-carrier-protein] hydrolase